MNIKPQYIAGGIILLLILIIGSCGIASSVGVTNDLNTMEANLSSKYSTVQTVLGACVQKSTAAAQVAKNAVPHLETYVSNAVKAWNGSGSTDAKQALISALRPAYPDPTALSDVYNRLLDTINGCQDDFQGEQADLQDMLRQYNTKRNGSLGFRVFGGEFPSDHLEAQVGKEVKTGKAAYHAMRTVIVPQKVNDAFTTGTVPDVNLGLDTPTTTVG